MDEMTCKSVRGSLWDYPPQPGGPVDCATPAGIADHLYYCRECKMHSAEVRSVRTGLGNLPRKHAPSILNTRLMILASRERGRMLARRDFATWLGEFGSRVRLQFDNLLKPFAVPAAGGILASFLCFGVLVNTLHVVPDWQNDMPIGLFTEVTIDEPSPFSHNGPDVLVQVTVDSQGRVTDYELPQDRHPSAEEMQEIGNLVLYTSFAPARRFGQAVSSKQLCYISHISVKG